MIINCRLDVNAEGAEMDALAKFIADGVPKLEEVLKEYGKEYYVKLEISMS